MALVPLVENALNLTMNFNILSSVDNPKGKWPNVLGNTIMVDIDSFYSLAVNFIVSAIDNATLQATA
jgi:hypothetical protein